MKYRGIKTGRIEKIGKISLILLALGGAFTITKEARGQALGEFAGVNAGVAGMGAGVAASMGNGALVKSTYESAVQAQQALVAQNKAVEQYFKMGNQFEGLKQWANAEKAFTYVLQVIARRDGPGSPKALPTLKHLTAVSQAQGKLEDAISYQKTVLAFTKAGKTPDKVAVVQESVNLSNLFIKRSDFNRAESVLHDSLSIAKQPGMPRDALQRTLEVYGKVLRQLDRNSEAQSVEAELSQFPTVAATPAPAETAPPQSPGASTSDSTVQSNYTATAAPSSQALAPRVNASAPLPEPAAPAVEPAQPWHRANNEPEPTPAMLPMPGPQTSAYTPVEAKPSEVSNSSPTDSSKTSAMAQPVQSPDNSQNSQISATTESGNDLSSPNAQGQAQTPSPSQQSAAAQQSTPAQQSANPQQGQPAGPTDFAEPQPLPMPITLPDGTTLPPQK